MLIITSIIIPSAGRRPELLQRAIKSALIDDARIQTEIIVILNGKNGMLFDESTSFQHPLVKYYKLEEGNVSKARNYGLSIAQGELIRFLDDDDYLIPEVAYKQYIELYNSDADLSTYMLFCLDELGGKYPVSYLHKYKSGSEAILSGEIIGTTLNNLYKKRSVENLIWNEFNHNGEDFEWFFSVLLSKKCKWIYRDQVVGAWFQHSNDRLSTPYIYYPAFKNNTENILKYYEYYQLEEKSKKFLAIGLWRNLHLAFCQAPIYWTKIGLYARTLDPNSRPSDLFFQKLPNWIHPLIIEWLMLPKRWMNHQFRRLKYKLGCSSYIRKI